MLEFIKSVSNLLNQKEIEYLIVGSAAQLIYHEKVNPSDLDIWVKNSSQNTTKLKELIKSSELISEFQNGKIIRVIGKPYSIDFHPKLDELKSNEIRSSSEVIELKNVKIKTIHKDDLKKNLETVNKLINGIITI